MTESFSEISRTGFLGRIGNSIKGIVVGGIFLLISVVLLFWNEGRAVKTEKMLKEGAASVVSVDSAKLDPANDGKLVHFTADAQGSDLTDPMFGVTRNAIHLRRTAEMYQWRETKESKSTRDTIGGGESTRTTYTYSKVWSDRLIDSSDFHMASGHTNPTAKRVESETLTPPRVPAGAFVVPAELLGRIDNFTAVPLEDGSLAQLPQEIGKDASIAGGKCYIAGASGRTVDSANPQIGDLRITLEAALPGPVSIIGRQIGDTVSAYPTHSGGMLELLYVGAHPAAEMFAAEQARNARLTWILRGVGFVVMWIGFAAIFQPLKVVSSFVGIIGDLVGVGIGIVAFLLSTVFSVTIIAIAWLVYRPLLGGSLLAVAAAATMYLVILWRRRAAQRQAAPTPIPAVAGGTMMPRR